MRQLHPVLLQVVAICVLLLLHACVPEIQSPRENEDWDPIFGIPLITAQIGMDDLLESVDDDGLLEVNEDNLLTVVYQEQISVVGAPALPPIPDFPITIGAFNQNIPNPTLNNPDFRLDVIDLKEGKLSYMISNPHPEPVNIEISFNDVRQNDDVLLLSFTIPAAPSTTDPVVQEEVVDISNYTVDFESGFQTAYTATLANSGNPVGLHPFLLEFSSLEFSYLEGYFGQFEVQIPTDSLAFGFLDKWEQGELSLVNPSLSFLFHHNYGAPIDIKTEQFSFETFTLGTQNIEHAPLINGFPLNYPNLSEVGQLKTTPLLLTANNSNVVDAISGIPYQMNYNFLGIINPDDDSSIQNHVLDEVQFDIDIEASIPIYGTAKGFTFEKTYDLDFSEFDDFEEVGLKVVAENGFPIDVDIQIYFLDTDEMIVDSLYTPERMPLFMAAATDSDGTVTSPTATEDVSVLGKGRFEIVTSEAVSIKIATSFETPNDGSTPVRIYDYYDLIVKLGLVAKL